MFEKSLYQLIRGLRNHKGNERAYIQDSLRECRQEIKSNDMDLKATALMKLTYLEMFGHDMSWASFNVLEVMAAPKYEQKRVGYLAAVQSFRSDTEVLMLAENQLKKDLTSPYPPTIALPLNSLPHVVNQSMANSLLSDLLPRLGHSHASVRKKTVITLYRLALVYPEILRPAWPKIKERLLDEEEDTSVIAATVNVVCELGSRRPQDFLPLAPRLFDLLVDGGNNWMAIKIIKLFANLTPLEPRLVKKLMPPLTTLIKSTPAMSLLYECISGIIHGGILQASSGTVEGDEVARLCSSKLRSMLTIEGDPNLKYVALLAFNKLVESHPFLVSMHEDVILECIDNADFSIRMRALDLVVGMVNAQNLSSIVDRLVLQLKKAPLPSKVDTSKSNDRSPEEIVPWIDDDDAAAQSIHIDNQTAKQAQPLPPEYRITVIRRILEMCGQQTYANINDFEWYIESLVELVKQAPRNTNAAAFDASSPVSEIDAGLQVGNELRNIAVRVKSSRREATRAAESLLRGLDAPLSASHGSHGAMDPVVWILGEYAHDLADPRATLSALIHPDVRQLPPRVISAHIQAAMKILASTAVAEEYSWTREAKSITSLLLARIIEFLDPLTRHSDLEVQERSVEYLELIRLANEAVRSAEVEATDAPLLLTQALPSLFRGIELNPVAPDAQRRVPVPDDLDLNVPINERLNELLSVPEFDSNPDAADSEFYDFYYTRPKPRENTPVSAAKRLELAENDVSYSYQQSNGVSDDPSVSAQRASERRTRNREDPFYIASDSEARRHDIIRAENADDHFDVDSIPIMELDLSSPDLASTQSNESASNSRTGSKSKPSKRARNFEILGDEDIAGPSSGRLSGTSTPNNRISPSQGTFALGAQTAAAQSTASKRSLLQVDSSGLNSLTLESGNAVRGGTSQLDYERRQAEEAEMAQALREVERLRLEMQRAQERVEAKEEEVVVGAKKKKKRRDVQLVPDEEGAGELADGAESKPKKKKKKKKVRDKDRGEDVEENAVAAGDAEATAPINADAAAEAMKTKKKAKRRQIRFDTATTNDDTLE